MNKKKILSKTHLTFLCIILNMKVSMADTSLSTAFTKAQEIVIPFTDYFFNLIIHFAVPATLINVAVIIFSSGEKRNLAYKILVGVIVVDTIALTKSNFFASIENLFGFIFSK